MLNPNPKLDDVRDCYGKKWGARDPDCVGNSTQHPCAVQDACRLEIAHGLVHPRRLTQGPTTPTPWVAHTPPGAQPVPAYTPPPANVPHPVTPAYQPLAAAPVNAAPTPQTQPYTGSLPLDVHGATLIPHATHTPATLSVPESRASGRKVQSFFLEILRAAAKGSAIQAGNFFDQVPFDPFDPRNKK